jgi:hypothetical protein
VKSIMEIQSSKWSADNFCREFPKLSFCLLLLSSRCVM